MTSQRSVAFAALLAAALAGCAQKPAEPVASADAGVTGVIPYRVAEPLTRPRGHSLTSSPL